MPCSSFVPNIPKPSLGTRGYLDTVHKPLSQPRLTQLFQPPEARAPLMTTTPGDIQRIGFARVGHALFGQLAGTSARR